MKTISDSIGQTMRIGSRIAKSLKAGDVVALIGELGSGKTVLTKGIAKGLGVKDVRYVNSPTFVIIKEYTGRVPLYHFDLYRLDKTTCLDAVSYDEYFYDDGVTVVEWADKIRKILPKKHLEIKLSALGENRRVIEIRRLPHETTSR